MPDHQFGRLDGASADTIVDELRGENRAHAGPVSAEYVPFNSIAHNRHLLRRQTPAFGGGQKDARVRLSDSDVLGNQDRIEVTSDPHQGELLELLPECSVGGDSEMQPLRAQRREHLRYHRIGLDTRTDTSPIEIEKPFNHCIGHPSTHQLECPSDDAAIRIQMIQVWRVFELWFAVSGLVRSDEGVAIEAHPFFGQSGRRVAKRCRLSPGGVQKRVSDIEEETAEWCEG